ncbi:MAG: hypothetical protein AB9882_07155 [Ignavibacteriaceae bacterium]
MKPPIKRLFFLTYMNIYLPNNLFGRLAAKKFPERKTKEIYFLPVQQITTKLSEDEESVGLIPTLDLINHRELFVSSRLGISFDGSLNNSYYYFGENQKNIKDIYMIGDITSVEVILTKVLMSELYNITAEIHLSAGDELSKEKNYLVAGDRNFNGDLVLRGISLSEEVSDHLEVPFVNYILASNNEAIIKKLHKEITEIDEDFRISDLNEDYEFSEATEEYISNNLSSLVIKFDESDIEGIKQLLLLPYYYQIVEDIFEIKFVS